MWYLLIKMHVVVMFLFLLGAFLLFPKGVKFMLASFMGFITGGFVWSIAAIAFNQLVTLEAFAAFLAGGIFCGCFLAMRG